MKHQVVTFLGTLLLGLTVFVVADTAAAASGNAAKGAKVYKKYCASCHSLARGASTSLKGRASKASITRGLKNQPRMVSIRKKVSVGTNIIDLVAYIKKNAK